MAPLTFHLLSVSSPDVFLTSIRTLPPRLRPLYVGETHHWIHEPELSAETLTGTPSPKSWTHLIVAPSAGTDGLELPSDIDTTHLKEKWSIAAPVDDAGFLNNYKSKHNDRVTSTAPTLLSGWSPQDHSGLDSSQPPSDLHASLALHSRPLGQPSPISLQDFIASFGTSHPGPVAMFNLLSYTPDGGKEKYYNYIQAFGASVGSKYGGEGLLLGQGVTAWSSKDSEDVKVHEGAGWDDCALVWYPSIWHFGKMLDDPEYAEVDRKFKTGSLRDNPLICCTEVEVEFDD